MLKKILIVEDEFIVADNLRRLLESAGYEVMGIADSYEKAIDLLNNNRRPDLALLDIRLNGKYTGIDLAARLKEEHIAFVYLSANSNQKILEEAKATEPYGFLVKPFRKKDLLVALDIAFYRHENSYESKLRRQSELENKLELLARDPADFPEKLLNLATTLQPAYKVAYLSRAISPSSETENAASGAANQFAGESRSAQAFEETANKKAVTKLIASDIKPNDVQIQGLGSSRQLVRWINEASVGEVSEPFNIDDKYIVAVLTEINKEGTMSVAKARPQVEFIVRNKKKAEVIKKKIGTANTIEAVATATQQNIQQSDSVRFTAPFIPNVGQEPKVIGASFNKANQAKASAPIAGTNAVFVVKTENVSAMSDGGVNVEEQRKVMMEQSRQNAGFRAVDALRKAATVKDERSKLL